MMQAIAALEGADHRVALRRARALQPQPQHGRRAAAGAQEERRRHPGRRVRQLREDGLDAGADGGARRAERRNSACRRARRSADAGAADGPWRRAAAGGRGRCRAARSSRRAAAGAAQNPLAQLERRAARRAAEASSPRSTRSSRRRRARTSRTSSITSTTSSRRSASTTSASRRTSTAAAAIDGWNGADETFNVTLELVRRGYTEEQIAQDLERQPAARDGRSAEGREEAGEVLSGQNAKTFTGGAGGGSSLDFRATVPPASTAPVMVFTESQARFASRTISPSSTITAATEQDTQNSAER